MGWGGGVQDAGCSGDGGMGEEGTAAGSWTTITLSANPITLAGGAVKRNTVASLQFGSRRDESGARNEAMRSRRGRGSARRPCSLAG